MAIGSCLAVFSAAMSISEPVIGYFSVALVIIGTLTSYTIRIQTLRSPIIRWDWALYAIAVICSIYYAGALNALMPESGFPREIAAAGWLSWMLILGSFATWQDSTLLFQAIPALALFGLVGCYDTYRFVTFNFFAFLICLATLFARAHSRQMLQQAANSGYFTRGLAPGTPIPSVETTPGLALELRKGPWRWVAGPEWALLSALAVVLLSLLGAPIIRQSVSGVAGMVALTPPPIKNQPSATASGASGQLSSVGIGRGPNHNLNRPVLEAKLDQIRYLREQSFQSYTGHGWRNDTSRLGTTPDEATPNDDAFYEMKRNKEFQFQISLLQNLKVIPLPAEAVEPTADNVGLLSFKDGTFEQSSDLPAGTVVRGKGLEIDPSVKPTKAVVAPELKKLLDTSGISPRVAQLALDVTKGAKNDYEKARLIEAEISKRILYNLDADPTPSDKDAVEYALFESHEGYCDLFASAMVIMARAVGIPARYVNGYLPDIRRIESNGSYVVTDLDYHAWAELIYKDAGWVVFDPTTSARFKEGEGLGDAGKPPPIYKRAVFQIPVAAVFIAALGFLFVRLYYRWQSKKPLQNPRSEAERSYLAFVKVLERTSGKRRMVGQTADEFLAIVAPSLNECFEQAAMLNERFAEQLFGPNAVSSEAVLKMREDIVKFGQSIREMEKRRARSKPE